MYRLSLLVLRLVSLTWRIKLLNEIPKSPVVIAFWHCDMLPLWKLFANKNATTLISKNKDGEILSYLLKKWKYKLIRGSSSKEGKEAVKEILELPNINYFLITPDGPRGPKYECKPGAFIIAQRKQIPLYFVECSVNCKKVFNKSWDNFILPMLFSKIEIKFSSRIDISLDANKEEISVLINEINKQFGK
ncbi:MAG: DUF374 domain-containing protein [Bacteroidetes bacterium]|nr:DUF374 domain-containing protein [Bacteroidota bacterium]